MKKGISGGESSSFAEVGNFFFEVRTSHDGVTRMPYGRTLQDHRVGAGSGPIEEKAGRVSVLKHAIACLEGDLKALKAALAETEKETV